MGVIRKFLAVAVTVAAIGAAPMAQAETLADAMIAAYKNSNLLDQNRALLRAADEDVAVAVAGLRPIVNFTLNSKYTNSEFGVFNSESFDNTANLSLELMLLDFGRNKLAIEAAKETVLATRQGLVDVEQRVLIATVEAYVNVRLTSDIVALRQSNLRLITQELRAAQDRFDVGEITRTDVAIAESRLASSRANLAAAEGELAVSREAYKLATGNYPGKLAPLPKAPKTATSLDEARAVALRTHPALRRAQHLVTLADLNVARAEAAMRPTLSLDADITMLERNPDSDLVNETVGLTFNQTLYAGGKLSALYRKALAGREADRAGLHQSARQLEQLVGNAWSKLEVSAASIDATDRQIVAARTAFDGLREEAKLGARTTLDVLNAEQDLLDAQSARLSAVATRYLGVYSLLQQMGLLTVEHLQLGIPEYDVTGYYNAVKDAPATSSRGKSLDRVLKAIGN